MEFPKVLLFGKNGQVGWELRRALAPAAQVVAVDFPEIDLRNPNAISQAIRETRPQIVINAAAFTGVDKAETDTDACNDINAVAPGIMAEESKRLGALLVHFSTDYVFDGQKGSPYTEEDQANPLGAYGRAKLEGDKAVQNVGGAHLIFRLCWVYGVRGQNFLLTMMRLARERDQLRVVHDQYGCPTWCRMIAEATTQAVRQVLLTGDIFAHSGLYHLAASGSTSWHGFAEAIVRLMPAEGKRCTSVSPITTAEYSTAARRPAHSVMDCSKLQRTFGLKLPDWEESLQQVFEA